MGAARANQIGSGDRSEKIRTYNFPQSRVTDHRINLTVYRLDSVINGDLDEFIDELACRDQAERLQAVGEVTALAAPHILTTMKALPATCAVGAF